MNHTSLTTLWAGSAEKRTKYFHNRPRRRHNSQADNAPEHDVFGTLRFLLGSTGNHILNYSPDKYDGCQDKQERDKWDENILLNIFYKLLNSHCLDKTAIINFAERAFTACTRNSRSAEKG